MKFKTKRLNSVMSHQFSQVPSANIQRSSFNRSHGYKTTFDAGYLVPIFVDEALPGDTFNCRMQGFARMATPIFPIMDNAFMETFFFAVPIRLIWDNWQKFNGEQRNPGDSTDFIVPTMTSPPAVGEDPPGYQTGSLHDYLTLPVGIANVEHSSFWHRAYNLIYNEWFRDENLQDSVVVDTDDGPDDSADYVLLRRGKRHDYFTSCLPWPQKGDSVELPLGSNVPIEGLGVSGSPSATPVGVLDTADGSTTYDQHWAGAQVHVLGIGSPATPQVYADLSQATAATINQLRQAFQIQKLLERDARGGTRYTEIIRSHFGVISPDARLQRPEYLGGGSSYINITPVPQTTSTDGTSPQGNLAATGTVSLNNHGFTKSFTEHCVIIGLVNVRADLTYSNGLNRMFSRSTRYDFYWPALAHIGEQAVLNKEIYSSGTATDDGVFGYQERYAEYRYKPSQLTGLMRTGIGGSLDAWHLAEEFESVPALNASFIQSQPPFDRVIAVANEPHFIFDSYFSLHCSRPMPLYGVPGLIDHF